MITEERQFEYRKYPKYDKLIRTLISGNSSDKELVGFYLKTRYSTFSPKEFVELVAPYMKEKSENISIPGMILGDDVKGAAHELDSALIWQEILAELDIEESSISSKVQNDKEEPKLEKE